jgi:hypothetical protein
LNATRKEIDRLISNIATSGGNDDRLRQKVQQSNLHAKQAEDAVASLTEQLDQLENLPEDDYNEWKSAKSAWQSQKDIYKACRNEFHEAKQNADREIQALTAEVTAFQQKRERMLSRINKLKGEYERITDANARGLDEAQRKATERAAKEAERARAEMMYMERLDTLGPQILVMQQRFTGLWAGINAMQQAEYLAAQAHAQQSPTSSVPNLIPYDIPEGNVPNTSYPWHSSNMLMPFSNPSLNSLNPQQGYRTRGRSSSMLSNVSGFTQSSVEEPPLPQDAHGTTEKERQKSEGSRSSGSSASDPKSPAAAKVPNVSRWSNQWDEK